MRRTSEDWSQQDEFKNFLIVAPDGWDRKRFYWSFNLELITKEEFKSRLNESTVMYDPRSKKVIT